MRYGVKIRESRSSSFRCSLRSLQRPRLHRPMRGLLTIRYSRRTVRSVTGRRRRGAILAGRRSSLKRPWLSLRTNSETSSPMASITCRSTRANSLRKKSTRSSIRSNRRPRNKATLAAGCGYLALFVSALAAFAATIKEDTPSTTYSFSYQRKGQASFSSGKSG